MTVKQRLEQERFLLVRTVCDENGKFDGLLFDSGIRRTFLTPSDVCGFAADLADMVGYNSTFTGKEQDDK